MKSFAFIVTGFDLREHESEGAARRQQLQLGARYPSRRKRFHIVKFIDGAAPTWAVSSFRYRRYPHPDDAEAARIACEQARPKKTYRIRKIET